MSYENVAMYRLTSTFGVAMVVAITVLAGIMYGSLSHRWGPSPDMSAAAARMSELPDQFGNWQLQSVEPFDPAVQEVLQCAGHLHHRYVNRKNPQEIVSVALIVGPSGPTAVHTPEICYSSRDYKTTESKKHVSVIGADEKEHQFWAMTFKRNDLTGATLRTYFAWTIGDEWSAPRRARFAFAGQPLLYKIQLSAQTLPGFNANEKDACQRFLEEFLPVANPILFDKALN